VRLQVVLLAVLGLWSIDSGLSALHATDSDFAAAVPLVTVDTEPILQAKALAALLAGVNPSLSDRELERIANAVLRYSAKYDLDPELVTAVMRVESNARPWVRSPKGAMGLMQVMPHMIGPLDLAGNPSSIESNIEVGCMILADNIRRLGEDDGILSYFWGSEIRGVSYLERVREARAAIRRTAES